MHDDKATRVAHIITGLGDGGAEAVLYRLCTHDTVHQHTVISLMDEGKYGPLLREAGIDVHCLYMPQGRARFRSLLQLWRLLRNLKPDVVQTWMYHADLIGGIVARLAGVSNVFWGIRQTDLDTISTKRSTIFVARLSANLSRLVPRLIISVAKEAVSSHARLGYDQKKFVVIPNGYNIDQFHVNRDARQRLRAKWGITDSQPLLGMVARFHPQKDHRNLLEALGLLKERGVVFRVALVGRHLEHGNRELRELVVTYNLQNEVILLGQRTDIPDIMNALDLHVLSSLTEGFPNVVAEAMACGTPCVTTDVGDAGLIVGDTGWVVPPRDPMALADAIQAALLERENLAVWTERQKDARQRIRENFSIEAMVEAYHRVWTAID